ncbi:MAG: carboxymuconolactone decarboxylase family protein [Methylovulum sp.]|uniref:carboxymuconolactone decarboxylase family protein n=1 Tax=Methylovulum sp. TaxID=1916980 RepID=UPI00261121B7|nr:carboxymuconolactone decarboxylase family protein [Methylovulum sp.]MDD2725554.1 carboxymuconolactone decarboxylase family protein [Methylovulum sp.]MDD5125376.1 carboxymuconolactone decarboxylase family protein [Methylovulum sp.]
MKNIRLKYFDLSLPAITALRECLNAVEKSGLEKTLLELVYLRVSQINGCAYCLNLHAKALREAGETDARIDMLAGWKVGACYSEAERAALAWAEALTAITVDGGSDAAFAQLKAFFTDAQISDLTIAIANMNALNRIAISMRV